MIISTKIIFQILLMLFVLLIQNSFPQSFFFLTLRPGVKSNAMGGAQTAIVNDYLSFYFNPAGLSNLKTLTTGYSKINYEFLGIVKNELSFTGAAIKTPIGVIGMGAYFYTNEIENFPSFKQRSYQLSFGRQLSHHLRAGLTLKYLYQNAYSQKASVFAGDLGLLIDNILPWLTLKLPFKDSFQFFRRFKKDNLSGLVLGISLLNTGPAKAEYPAAVPEPLSQILNLGLGYKIIESDFLSTTLAIDLNKILVRIQNGKEDNFIKAWFTSWQESGFDGLHSGLDLNFFHLVSLYFGYEKFYTWESDNNDELTLWLWHWTRICPVGSFLWWLSCIFTGGGPRKNMAVWI